MNDSIQIRILFISIHINSDHYIVIFESSLIQLCERVLCTVMLTFWKWSARVEHDKKKTFLRTFIHTFNDQSEGEREREKENNSFRYVYSALAIECVLEQKVGERKKGKYFWKFSIFIFNLKLNLYSVWRKSKRMNWGQMETAEVNEKLIKKITYCLTHEISHFSYKRVCLFVCLWCARFPLVF